MTDYEIKVQNFRCLNAVAKKGETVFVGSSLCELFPISEMLQNVEPRIRVYNRGIGGDVTDGLLRRMDESIFALEPEKVFINIGTNDLAEVMREHHMVEGFDVGLEMSGSDAALHQLLDNMRNGGKIALLGIFSRDAKIDWNQVIFKGLTIQGIYGRKMYETWYKMAAMVQSGLDLTPLITHRFHYTEFEKGFEAMNTGKSGKVILSWED